MFIVVGVRRDDVRNLCVKRDNQSNQHCRSSPVLINRSRHCLLTRPPPRAWKPIKQATLLSLGGRKLLVKQLEFDPYVSANMGKTGPDFSSGCVARV